jgi:hypothetical protein
MKDKNEFDVNQGHGNHIDCVCEPGTVEEFISSWMPKSISEGEFIAGTEKPIKCDIGDGEPKEVPIVFLGNKRSPLRLQVVLAIDVDGEKNMVVSAYPEYDGAEVLVKITKIHEWAAGFEATIEGEILGEAAREMAFFDTRYALCKGKYEIGKTYKFRIAAFAYDAQVLPEKDREFRLEGDDAVKHRERCGMEQEYEEDGSPKPVIFRMESMVAYLPKWGPYPDDAEFQSPAFGAVEEIKAFDTTFCKFNVSIARDEDDVIIPMIARKSLFDAAPETDDPVRGMLWLQGYCAETMEEKIRTDK